MNISQRIALLLVAIWLIIFGLSGLGLNMGILVPLLALVAGIVLLIAEW